jgi:iron complex outermembrane recepter protein
MSSNLSIRQAVSLGLSAGATAAASLAFSQLASAAPAAETGPNQEPSPNVLDEVVVTGSRIRRIDTETANPVQIIDQKAIQESGITTIGDLVQRIPSISGKGTNPSVNNGGGYAESNIELRGLDAKRTLILVDGRRIGLVGTTSDATDVNQIPINLIDRIEVLKEGAGAIYGSDAIGGVVNFITRKDVDGLEVTGDFGRTGRRDGDHHSVGLIFGTNTDRMNIQVGGSLFQQDVVYATRDYSKYALYLYGGSTGVTRGGSTRVPTGRIFDNPLGLTGTNGKVCSSLTHILGQPTNSLSDYRCFNSPADNFNYQPLNLIQTPVERTSVFGKANYKINDDVEAYATVTETHTHSGFHEAPLPFDSQADNITLSKSSIYNPFGIDFGGNSGANPDFSLRTFLFGSRQSDTTGDGADFNGGVKGKIDAIDWTWDLNLTYSRFHQHTDISGYYFASKLNPAVGPSFIDPATGTPTCGTVAVPIQGCTPINLFDQFANSAAALAGLSANYNQDNIYDYKAAALDFTGKIFTLPAGDLQAAVGFEYNDRAGKFVSDAITLASPPLYLTCGLSQETCSGNAIGKYNSKQEYLELNIPILKDLPLVHSLNADIGVRHNDYSLFGQSTKADFKVEYRPIKDLLVRGTFSQVLRVPTVNDLAAAPVNTSVTFNDPCTGLTAAQLAATPNLALACKGVVPNGTFKEDNGQITGLNESNPNLKPETGKVKTAGIVFDPSFVPGLSVSADYWSYHIDGLITTLDANYSINQCIATASPTFCSLVTRYTSGAASNLGKIQAFVNPSFNLGSLDTSGVDIGLKYTLRDTPFGAYQFALDWTHTNNYTNNPAPGSATQEIGGTYSTQWGNNTKNRALASLGWTWHGVDALFTSRFIGGVVIEHPSVTGFEADGVTPWPPLKIGSVIYEDLTVGYTIAASRTHVQAGVRNISDKQPPIFYQNNVTNANTDVQTYDLLGRQWFIGFTQKL